MSYTHNFWDVLESSQLLMVHGTLSRSPIIAVSWLIENGDTAILLHSHCKFILITIVWMAEGSHFQFDDNDGNDDDDMKKYK